jgi:hypothetical protein
LNIQQWLTFFWFRKETNLVYRWPKNGKNYPRVNLSEYLESDPVAGSRFEMTEVFAHAPAEYEIKPWKLTWKQPCWIHADIILSPQTAATREKFLLNLNMPHRIDAYAREPWADQLWAAFAPRLSQIAGPHSAKWWDEMMSCHGKLEKHLGETETLFPQPFRFAMRKEFVTVDLAAILKASPEALNIYLGLEKGKYGNSFFLRIHSGPPHLGLQPKCLWFEKRMPYFLHEDDVLPWFLATIQRLPKKTSAIPKPQPASVQSLNQEVGLGLAATLDNGHTNTQTHGIALGQCRFAGKSSPCKHRGKNAGAFPASEPAAGL